MATTINMLVLLPLHHPDLSAGIMIICQLVSLRTQRAQQSKQLATGGGSTVVQPQIPSQDPILEEEK